MAETLTCFCLCECSTLAGELSQKVQDCAELQREVYYLRMRLSQYEGGHDPLTLHDMQENIQPGEHIALLSYQRSQCISGLPCRLFQFVKIIERPNCTSQRSFRVEGLFVALQK